MLHHTARINCLAWSPDSSMVATGSLDTCVIIYEINKPLASRITIKGAHLGGVYGLAFTDERSVVSPGEDACVLVSCAANSLNNDAIVFLRLPSLLHGEIELGEINCCPSLWITEMLELRNENQLHETFQEMRLVECCRLDG
ncbi:hypothetical protein ACH5RR_024910 [Cinchona calisaya]|uniref:Uncharacterized protein n=1 Tax=Cinchona calisaya TaxID=153742 RepID=A0ABD2Z354_9GENT